MTTATSATSTLLAVLVLLLGLATHAFRTSTRPRFSARATLAMAGGQVPMVPYYPDKTRPKEYQWMDIYNALGRERSLFVGRFLDEEASNQLIASLIWLQGQNSKDPITLYFNVPGAISKVTHDATYVPVVPLAHASGLLCAFSALCTVLSSFGSRRWPCTTRCAACPAPCTPSTWA